ncbi:hypothetical protein MIR68_012102 [Amoeboaphelidium protococcarum]|nr:hypothetical protein MIR68_012102 [Amoeboaphelidium protococcarum]
MSLKAVAIACLLNLAAVSSVPMQSPFAGKVFDGQNQLVNSGKSEQMYQGDLQPQYGQRPSPFKQSPSFLRGRSQSLQQQSMSQPPYGNQFDVAKALEQIDFSEPLPSLPSDLFATSDGDYEDADTVSDANDNMLPLKRGRQMSSTSQISNNKRQKRVPERENSLNFDFGSMDLPPMDAFDYDAISDADSPFLNGPTLSDFEFSQSGENSFSGKSQGKSISGRKHSRSHN